MTVEEPNMQVAVADASDASTVQAQKLEADDAKAVADKYPMKPPKVKVMSDWSDCIGGGPMIPGTRYRHICVDGRPAVESWWANTRSWNFVSEVW